MEALIPLALQLLQFSLPAIAGVSPQVAAAIKLMTVAAPIIQKTYADLKPVAQRIIATLKADKSTTPEQIAELEAAEAVLDQEFDDAAAAALEADAAAKK